MRGLGISRRGIWYQVFLVGLTVIVFGGTRVRASETSVTCNSLIKFAAGVVSVYAIHEGSHAIVAGLTGTHLDWEIGTYNQPMGFTEDCSSDAKGFAVDSAGLLGQLLTSEVILQTDAINKNDAFVRGMMAWNIANPIIYAFDYWFIRISNKQNGRGYQGDLEGVEHYSTKSTANVFTLSMVAIAAFQGYRFLKTQSWAPHWLKQGACGIDLEAIPSGGLAMTYSITF